MKKFIIALLVIFGVFAAFAVLYYRSITESPKYDAPKYAIAESLKGIGCIRLGETRKEVAAALDSCYLAYQPYLKKHYNSIDFVTVERNKMLEYVGPWSTDTPDTYNKDYRRYYATVIISEQLATDKVELYFWRDTLQKIRIGNNNTKSKDIAEAMIWKYGKGEGYYKKTSNEEDQLHKWGNDRCVATYHGKTEYTLNREGLANGIRSWYHSIEITLNDTDMQRRINKYLHEADSLWTADTYSGI